MMERLKSVPDTDNGPVFTCGMIRVRPKDQQKSVVVHLRVGRYVKDGRERSGDRITPE